MNTRNPLAAALLLIASSAAAQPLPQAGSGGQFSGGNSNPGFNLGSMTDPAGAFGPTQFMGTSPDVQWADPKCNFIPCNTVDSAKSGKDQAALEKRMAEQKKLTPNDTVVDMGDGKSFGIIFVDDKGNKTISIDNGSSCGMPRALTPEEDSKFAAQIAKGESKKADQTQADKSINGDKGGMKINSFENSINGDGTTPPAGSKGAQTPPPNTIASQSNNSGSTPDGSGSIPNGYQDGQSIGSQANAFGSNSGSAGYGSGGADSAGGSGGGNGQGQGGGRGDTVVAAKAISYAGSKAKAEAEAGGITYIGLLPHQANIEKLGKAFSGGQLGDLSAPNAAAASGRLAEPPTSTEQGKMQFGANSAPEQK